MKLCEALRMEGMAINISMSIDCKDSVNGEAFLRTKKMFSKNIDAGILALVAKRKRPWSYGRRTLVL